MPPSWHPFRSVSACRRHPSRQRRALSRRRLCPVLLTALAIAATAFAQQDDPGVPTVLKAGTPVLLTLSETIDSATHERGAKFAFTVAVPVTIDGVTLIPAGARAEGEVVHSDKPGMFGKPAELTLTSRAVVLDDRRIHLRGLVLAESGHSRENAANGAQLTADVLHDLEILSGAASGAYGIALAAFVQGKRIVVPAGTELVARVANDESFGDSRARTESAVPAVEQGTIVFYRLPKPILPAGSFMIREGKVDVGMLRRGQFFIIKADPGIHEYTVHWEAKDVVTIEVEPAETSYVRGEINRGFVVPRPNLAPSSEEAFESIRAHLEEAPPLHDDR